MIVEDITPSIWFLCTLKVIESVPTIAKFLIWVTEWTPLNDCSHDDGNKRGSKGQRGHMTNFGTLSHA